MSMLTQMALPMVVTFVHLMPPIVALMPWLIPMGMMFPIIGTTALQSPIRTKLIMMMMGSEMRAILVPMPMVMVWVMQALPTQLALFQMALIIVFLSPTHLKPIPTVMVWAMIAILVPLAPILSMLMRMALLMPAIFVLMMRRIIVLTMLLIPITMVFPMTGITVLPLPMLRKPTTMLMVWVMFAIPVLMLTMMG